MLFRSPACLTLMPLEYREGMLPAWKGWRKIKWGPKPAPGFLLRHAESISLWALVLGFAAAVVYLPRLQFDFDPMNLKDPTTESVQTALDLMKDSETSFYTIQILADNVRSEEHTSELQSRRNLVCRLLLEKKNTYSLLSHTLTPRTTHHPPLH